MLENVRLDHIALGSPDPGALAAFYAEALGMTVRIQGHARVCRGPQRCLVIVDGQRNTLGFGAYAFPDRASITAYRHILLDRGIDLMPSPSMVFDRDAFAVEDPDGNHIVFGVHRRDRYAAGGGMAARLQHLVVASTDIERMREFYCDVLGFRASDRVADDDDQATAYFLRSDNEHHSFAIFRGARNRLDHHCYEAGEWSMIRDWGDHFAALHVPVAWGPGRHGPGNNLFLMIHDPDGNWIEISAELEVVASDSPTGQWRHEERTLNSWGQAFLRS